MSEHRIKPKRTTTSGIDGVPTTSNLEAGEIAINLADKKLFVRDTSNNILELTTRTINSLDDATISSPTTGEVLTYNAGLVGWENTAATSAEWVTTEHVVTSAGQQAFSAAYTVGSLDVFLNGIRLDTSDYTAYSGILIILDTGAAIGDTVYISSYTLTSGALPSQSGNSGKYLTTNGSTATWATIADANNYVDSLAFSTTNGILTVGRSGSLGDLTVDLDGKYLPLTGGVVSGTTTFNYGINVTGNITATGTITAYYSDERLKTNLGNISSPLDKVLKLNGFNYIENKLANSFGYDSTSIQVGVSAQDVQKVLPAAVSIAPFDRGEKGLSKSGEDYLTVDYAKMVPLLIEAIKELKEEVDSLKGARDEQ
jgi:hypothetical protein